jgi:DhnA family fructose-bisphosphate aldolase class Ia
MSQHDIGPGQQLRLRDFIADDGKSVIVDCTAGLLGIQYRPLSDILPQFKNSGVDAIILSPGEARRHFSVFATKEFPALLIKCDWSNWRLDNASNYPKQQFRQVPISSVEEALRLGASGVIVDVFFGESDVANVEGIQVLRQLAESGFEAGCPVIANIIASGSRITDQNWEDVILLGARVALEVGAIAVSIPPLSEEKIAICKNSAIESPIFVNNLSNFRIQSALIPSVEIIQKHNLTGIICDGFGELSHIMRISGQIHN